MEDHLFILLLKYECWYLFLQVETPEDTEESPDDEEEVQTYEAVESQVDEEEAVNLEDLEKVSLDLLVTKFLQGKLIITIHFGFFFFTTSWFTLSLCRWKPKMWTIHSDMWSKKWTPGA